MDIKRDSPQRIEVEAKTTLLINLTIQQLRSETKQALFHPRDTLSANGYYRR
jgi:hypothetical protein